MLTQANRLYNPKANATVSGQGHITVGPADFLNYAADASGLELSGFKPTQAWPTNAIFDECFRKRTY